MEGTLQGSPMAPRRRKFTPVVIREIPHLVDQGRSPAEIAKRIGCTISTLRVRCSQLKISLRRDLTATKVLRPRRKSRAHVTVFLSTSAVEALRRQATSEGMSDAELAAALLEAITRDGLYKAVLDRE